MINLRATDELNQLLNAVLAAPDDDLPRGVYADCLEEWGNRSPAGGSAVARAEFIRVQLRLARWAPGRCPECGGDGHLDGLRRLWCANGHEWNRDDRLPLVERERQLIHDHWRAWVPEIIPDGESYPWQLLNGGIKVHAKLGVYGAAVFTRGFVDELSLPLAEFTGTEVECPNFEESGSEPDTGALVCCRRCDNTGVIWEPGAAHRVFMDNPVAVAIPSNKIPTSRNVPGIPIGEPTTPEEREYAWMQQVSLPRGGENVRFELPSDVFMCLKDGYPWAEYFRVYPSMQAAYDDLSRVIVAGCRDCASLALQNRGRY